MTGTLRIFKKLAATLFLLFGIPFSAAFIADMMSPNNTSEEKEDALAALLIATLPSTALGGWLVWGLHQDHKRKLAAESDVENDRLQSVFFQVLEENSGQATILRMAKEACISKEEAQEYLDRKALEFDATYEVGEQGEITYQFHL